MQKHATELDGPDYLASLVLTPAEPRLIKRYDGAELWWVGTGHYVLLLCLEHAGHRGGEYLIRYLPPNWVCFYVGVNPEAEFEAHHYGPEWPADEKETADAH